MNNWQLCFVNCLNTHTFKKNAYFDLDRRALPLMGLFLLVRLKSAHPIFGFAHSVFPFLTMHDGHGGCPGLLIASSD